MNDEQHRRVRLLSMNGHFKYSRITFSTYENTILNLAALLSYKVCFWLLIRDGHAEFPPIVPTSMEPTYEQFL